MADDRTPGDVLPPPLVELADIRQWVTWKRVPDPKNPEKPKKIPRTPGDGHSAADEANRRTWSTYSEVHRGVMTRRRLAGVGFVFTTEDDYVGVDLDKCGDRATGQLEPWAQAIVERLESYTEWSPSGTGVHILCRGVLPPGGRKRNRVEMYDCNRYFTVTGRGYGRWGDLPITERIDVLAAVHAEHFPPPPQTAPPVPVATRMPSSQTDDDLWSRMFSASNGADIRRLYDGDTSGHLRDDGTPDHSGAVWALVRHLAWWTNHDATRTDRMFRQSRLYTDNPRKWDRLSAQTIAKAFATVTGGYTGSTVPEWQPTGDGAAGIAVVERSPATKREPAAVLADSDAASLFVGQAGGDYRWVVDDERWLHWDGTRWNGDVTDTEVRHRAMLVVDQALREYGEATSDGERDRTFVRWLAKCRSRTRLDAMVSLAKGNPVVTVRAADLDRDRNMLVVRNGVVDLQNGQLLPHSRADLYTRIVRHGLGHDGVPAEYRPVAELRVPPAWQAFLDRVQPDPAVRDFLQLVIGAALSGTGSERRIVVMHGPGGTGKGTFMATIMAALGGETSGYVTTGDAEVLMMSKNPGDGSSHLAGVARWRGKRVVWLDETADGRRLDAGKVKRLIPGDGGEVVARDLYERGRDTRAFPATWLPIMTTNHLPIAPADDDAIWDRLIAVPWDTRIPPGERTDVSASLPRDPEVLEYVLSWAVDGAVRWHQARTGKSGSVRQSGIGTPVAVGVATDAWQRRSESASGAGDALTEWLRSDGVVEGDYDESLTDLHASHTAWARSVRTHPMTVRAFTTALRARGMKLVRQSGGNVWNGIGLMSQTSHDG